MKPPNKPDPSISLAKEAMADFYQELLGSLDKSPLDRLAERELPTTSDTVATPSGTALQKRKTSPSGPLPETIPASPELTSRSAVSNRKPVSERPVLIDAPVVRNVLASPVLRGALPKLAPAPELEKPSVQSVTVSNTEVSLETRNDQRQPSIAVPAVATVQAEAISVISTRKGLDAKSDQYDTASELVNHEESPKSSEWLENGRPSWAQDRFECLLFVVAGLTLAVPLVSLGAIYRLDDELISLVGRANWFMGLFRQAERSVQVVDTAQWVMPDRWTPEVRHGYRFIIRLGDGNWALATDSVQQSINLAPEQVKWRTERSKRSWLAGTVIDHMCALLDADKLAELLSQDAVKNRR